MAASGDVVKKVMLFKLQLSDAAEPATVLQILQKLKKLDITLDILVETGIGKAVNSLRRHKEAGKIAKSLVTGWKKLMSKESTCHVDDGELSGRVPVKEKLDGERSPGSGGVEVNDITDSLTSNGKNRDSSDESRKMDSDKAQHRERKRKKSENKNAGKPQQGHEKTSQDVLTKKNEIQACKMENSALFKKKKCSQSDRKSVEGETLNTNEELEDPQKSKCDSKEKLKAVSESLRSERESKSTKESSQKEKEPFPLKFSDKPPKKSKGTKDVGSSGTSVSLESPKRKREKAGAEKRGTLKYRAASGDKEHSEHKKAKKNPPKSQREQQEPAMSFESFLNYDENVFKMKKPIGKKPTKKVKRVVKEEKVKDHGIYDVKSPASSPQQKFRSSIMHLKDIPLPAALPECENPSSVEYFERKVEKESDMCDISEESGVFTGQRLYKKMQVYSGAKTAFLPAMMSLYQQCIRTLQNNINLLHETGGVPFEILEPVLERCTPEQLLHVEECNPSYIGMTDHLWGRHCQRDFKDSKLQEYESWKEMYVRLFEEREMKLKRLTKTIVSAQSRKPQGRQLKMAFINTVAKPPRDVRLQQELHGTAAQQPHLLSIKAQDNRSRLICNEPSSSSSSSGGGSGSSGGNGSQDPRKKTRVAPMMAKSLKAFKKQLQRR